MKAVRVGNAQQTKSEEIDMLSFSPLPNNFTLEESLQSPSAVVGSHVIEWNLNENAVASVAKPISSAICTDSSYFFVQKVLDKCIETVVSQSYKDLESCAVNTATEPFVSVSADTFHSTKQNDTFLAFDFSDTDVAANHENGCTAEIMNVHEVRHAIENIEAEMHTTKKNDNENDLMDEFADFAQNSSFEDFEMDNSFGFQDPFSQKLQESRFDVSPEPEGLCDDDFADFEAVTCEAFDLDWDSFFNSFLQDRQNESNIFANTKAALYISSPSHPAFDMYKEQAAVCPTIIEEILASHPIHISKNDMAISDSRPTYEWMCLQIMQSVLSEKLQKLKRYCNGNSTFDAARDLDSVQQVLESTQKVLRRGNPTICDIDQVESAIISVQNALFDESVHGAIMQIAKHAALSAEAKIAEQFAQQNTARTSSSILSSFQSTRHLLGRGHSSGSITQTMKAIQEQRNVSMHEKKRCTPSPVLKLPTETPTSASVHKMPRQNAGSNSNTYSIAAKLFGNRSQEEDGSVTATFGGPSGDESEASSRSSIDSRSHNLREDNRNLTASDAEAGQESSGDSSMHSIGSGNLIRKFASTLLSSATSSSHSDRNRRRTVMLRAMHTNEEVRRFELDLDDISGGFDEVKWKCAGFLYDPEDVVRIAPSQIRVWAHPTQQLLVGRSQKSILNKFFKPQAVWTIDIGDTAQLSDDLTQ